MSPRERFVSIACVVVLIFLFGVGLFWALQWGAAQ